MNPIRLLLVDDHFVVREGLRTVLGQHAAFAVVGEAADGAGAIAAYRQLRPDVTLMDLRLPDMSGAAAIGAIRRDDAQAKILVLTSFDSRGDVEQALSAGARGFLLKAASAEDLMNALRRVHAGLKAIEPRLQALARPRHALPQLTPREAEVLHQVVAGQRNQQIGAALGMSLSTVKFHLQHVLQKLEARDRTEAAMIAVRDGLVRLA